MSFGDGATSLAANVPMSGNTATYITSSLSVGTHNLSAHYSGDATYAGSTGLETHTVDRIFADGLEGFTLTIDNYLSWCSVSENGVAYSASKVFPPGTVVALHGDAANSTFVWGYWTGTDADTGSHDTNKDAQVTMSTDRSVQACCPFASSSDTPCP